VIHFKHDVRRLMARDIADALRPRLPMAPSVWAAKNLVVPDGPRAGRPFDLGLTAYLAEPLDMLGPDSPVNEIAVMKSAQTGFTLMLIALLGHLIDRSPCRALVVQPTSDAAAEFNREKLDPAIRASSTLKRKVATQTSRSTEGSTTYSKKFAGGSITLAIASSAADLRSKTVRVLLRDETDAYPDDLDGQGDPLDISDGRLMSFLASGDWKKCDVSTPTIKGASKIERRYEQGDQRRWHVPCPGCAAEFVFEFGPQFRFEPAFPHRAYYVAPCCGVVIEAHQRDGLVRQGRWIAGAARPGAFPSYHFDALSSPFVPWDEVPKADVAAGDSPTGLKTFTNIWLGRPFEVRGDAPDHVRLMERREEGPPRGHVPREGLLLVSAADVQLRGIWVEVVAFGSDRQSWTVDAFYCDGGTDAPGSIDDAPDSGNAFSLMLRKTIGREFPDAYGRTRRLDALGLDSGYRSHIVYETVRANQRLHENNGMEVVYALDGRDGWARPPIGSPSLVDIDLAGHKVLKGCKIWPTGTWPLKGAFYSDLRKDGVKSGAEADPPGYCHFGTWLDETYFRQLTSEYLAEETYKGRARKFWKLRASERDNHWLDTRIMCMALAEHLGLSALTPSEWAGLARERGGPASAALGLSRDPGAPGAAPGATLAALDATDDHEVEARLERLAKANAARFR
jgi:phage terminase large subunit GpA-like protein